jgi:hypothetical protein
MSLNLIPFRRNTIKEICPAMNVQQGPLEQTFGCPFSGVEMGFHFNPFTPERFGTPSPPLGAADLG